MSELQLRQHGEVWVGGFRAMASPCEVHIEIASRTQAEVLARLAMQEAQRIEQIFSRYRDDNLVWQINNSAGQAVTVDEEFGRMLDFASTCFELSDGLFDVTSGVLRKAWNFDGSDNLPAAEAVNALLPNVGWQRARWCFPQFTLPDGMQIDFGGIAKEYAVDRSLARLDAASHGAPCLVNYGGDLHANKPPTSKQAWQVGIEKTNVVAPDACVQLTKGALATSGNAHRFLLKDGVRYSHVLNPRTGWPIAGAPASVTVAGDTCLQAGMLSTIATLKGPDAETFLQEQDVQFWCQW